MKSEWQESPAKVIPWKWKNSGELVAGCNILVKRFKDDDGNSKKWRFEEESASSSNESLGYEI